MTTIQARNLDDAMDTIELALSDYRARNKDYRNARIIKERINSYNGLTHNCIAPNGSQADALIKKNK